MLKEKSFIFWRENKTDQEHFIGESDLVRKFKFWLPFKEVAWLNYYRIEAVIRCFLTDKAGINSVFKESEFKDMYELLKPVYISHMQEVDPENWRREVI